MSLTTKQIAALDKLPQFVPAVAQDQTGGTAPLALGTEIAAIAAGLTPGVVTSLKTAATASSATDAATSSVADATDLATAIALVNDLKAKYNAACTLINDLKTKHNALSNGIDAL